MWGPTKTYKIVYYDHTVNYGDKKRSTFVEAYTQQDAIHKFQMDYAGYVVRDCILLFD
jgi:predicted glycosyltransferase